MGTASAAALGYSQLLLLLVRIILVLYCSLLSSSSTIGAAAAVVPAVYVFGDSLADVGNNNHLDFSLLKADFPHNGIDYPGGQATGRFSNGYNSADFLVEKIGAAAVQPYLAVSSTTDNEEPPLLMAGVSFASGGAGVLDSTNKGQCLTLNEQIDYFSTVYGNLVQNMGDAQTQHHLSKSIFTLMIGSNDILVYSKSSSSNQIDSTPQQFVDSMVSKLRGQLKRIYNLGARKFVYAGTGPVGCCPALRNLNSTGDCYLEANYLSLRYSKGVASLLQEMKSELSDMSYTFFDGYNVILKYIQNPADYGFAEVKVACCGLGNLNAQIACLPISTYCPNREDHLFWDLYHPTEAAASMLASALFDGPPQYAYPINVKQLIAL